MTNLTFHTLDVFTNTRFAGNPLAVVLGADALSTEQMQTIAIEFGYSETTFVFKPTDNTNTAKVRIFTPAHEMPFAGHPTIGTAVLLSRLDENKKLPKTIKLEELAGVVEVTIGGDGKPESFGQLTSPTLPKSRLPGPRNDLLALALNINPENIGFNNHNAAYVSASSDWLFVPLANLDAVSRASINSSVWPNLLGEREFMGVYVYTRGGQATDTDFHSRMFSPSGGIPEDPATGSATATFPGQLIACEPMGDGTHRYKIEQGYEMGRPSELYLEADVFNNELQSVRVAGSAVIVMSGTFEV